jgi:uncharacterized membrane protein YgdD (TMEM256/DUF423 family)
MNKSIQLRGIIFAGLAVILGAFGAHALKAVLPADRLPIFETGVRYQLIHAIALIVLSIVTQNTWTKRAAKAMTIGIILFSGSLYLIATNSILPFTLGAWIGPITPIGGLFFISGWFCWGMAAYRG